MRFNSLVTASFYFVTLAMGLVIPANSAHDIEVREGLVGSDTADIFVRANILKSVVNALKPTYHVPAGPGKPAHLHPSGSQAGCDAKTEAARLAAPGVSNRSKKNSPLKTFNNNDHHVPKTLGTKKTFPLMKGTAKEYPLPNKSGNPGKGPARVILQEKPDGQLKFKGVVSHDQSRPEGTRGANDHFRVLPKINPFKKP